MHHGGVATVYAKAAEDFVKEFRRLVESEVYIAQQVFSCDETGLFWKKRPKKTYTTVEEMKMPGHKPVKDRLILLFCANVSGNLKIKPFLVYRSEPPQAFKGWKVHKSCLSVMRHSNTKAWVTRLLFAEWIR